MKKIITKNIVLLFVFLLQISSHLAQTRAGMSLGNIEFIMPTSNMTLAERTLKMSMSNSFITTRFVSKVGGVTFVQTAEPEFTVNSISLKCDTISNKAYATINGKKYIIPLENWKLIPIVNYANDNNNAIVTLFGDYPCKIKYHEAFVDKLLGLRILQTDLLLTKPLNSLYGYELPKNENGIYILANSEKDYEKVFLNNNELSKEKSYVAYNKIYDFIQKDPYNSYLFTDFNEKITFNVDDKNIIIKGLPYYRFTKTVKEDDSIDVYEFVLEFIKNYDKWKDAYKNKVTDKDFLSDRKINKIKNIIKTKKSIQNKADEISKIINYNDIPDDYDSLCAFVNKNSFSNDETISVGEKYDRYKENKQKIHNMFKTRLMIVTSEYYAGKNPSDSLKSLCDRIRLTIIYNDDLEEIIPILTIYTKHLLELYPDEKLNEYIKYVLTNDERLTIYIHDKKAKGDITGKKAVVVKDLTSWLKNHNSITGDLNPIIIDEATEVCQWSAFFRYVKNNNPKNWNSFVSDIKKLKYDAPIIQTPINWK